MTNLRKQRQNPLKFSVLESTDEHFKALDQEGEDNTFYGPYAHIRCKLDYSYHSNYRKERQWLQDSIIEDLMDSATSGNGSSNSLGGAGDCPWFICTVGAPGAGKHYALQQLLANHGLFGGHKEPFLHVDTDEIRRRLPEFESYCSKRPSDVDTLTRREAGFLMEILVHCGLQAGIHVVLDGSLQDADWFSAFFASIRKEYAPQVQIAIFNVTAPRDLILERGKIVEEQTKRVILEEKIDRILAKIPKSIAQLKDEVDFCCEFENLDDADLTIKPGSDGDMSWDVFHETFSSSQNGDSLTPLKILPPKPLHRKKNRTFSALLSSEENYRAEVKEFFGPYSHIRATLDYSYHECYTRKRQLLQDRIIADMLGGAVITDKDGNVCTTPTEPWIVFTAGAMGAGKSYTMNKLVEAGRFPLLAFVLVDPDEIRRHLPEFHVYVDQSPELAGELTRKESGFIAEILTLAGLQAGKNVLVDGSLRDSEWYKGYFARLKKEFPTVRHSILHVTAPREAIFQRAADRAKATGRIVPRETLQMAIEQVPRSVKILGPLVDFFCELNNAPGAPDIELLGDELTWETFESNWVQTCAWVPSRRKFLRNAKDQNAKLAIGGRKIR